MKVRDLKYLFSYLLPSCYFLSLYVGSELSFLTFAVAFGAIPLLEMVLKGSDLNDDGLELDRKSHTAFFKILLHVNVILIYLAIIYTFINVSRYQYSNLALFGIVLSLGTLLGSSGINVAHELGHKNDLLSKISAKLLLIPCLYTHFIIEHNFGHHLYVSTPQDPATAKKGQTLYSFWYQSVIGCYINAWKLSFQQNKNANIWTNEMLWNTFLIAMYLLTLLLLNTSWFWIGLLSGIVSFLLLETINYIEHYGLSRSALTDKKYEPVQANHSWNSNHQLGRIMLYELTRHSDHHYKANKDYQLLLHHDISPQLPFGYPASMVLALVPPLWFNTMNPLLEK